MQTHQTLVATACAECGSQANLARAIGLSPAMVNQMTKGIRTLPIEHGAAIEIASNYRVMRWDFFPNEWYRIWPELIGMEGAPDFPQAPAIIAQAAINNIAQGV